ncbi:MAG TPA: hypothetical protein VFM18_03055 [Methanosarcina sp.]|nr:hypothetical protein [Methanosarcina sp.]
MIKRQSGRTRNEYMQLISEYNRRKEKYPKGSKMREKLRLKVNRFKRALKRIKDRGLIYTVINGEYRELPKQIHEAAAKIDAFFSESVRASHSGRSSNYSIAQRCFCKYAMELGCYSRDVSFFLGAKNPNAALYARLRFTRSFKTTPENRRIYHSFLASTKQ